MTDPVTIWSLLVGSLGLQTAFVGGWMRWQQLALERQQEEEEETETVARYESKDTISSTEVGQPNGSTKRASRDPRLIGWEFKIVRADRDLFRDAAILKQLCDEEESAGWIMLEKLDDRRIRFKRPIALREIINADFLPFDPYRTHYGPSSTWKTGVLAIVALTVLLLPAYLGYILVSTTLSKTQSDLKPQPNSSNAPPPERSPLFQSPQSPQSPKFQSPRS